MQKEGKRSACIRSRLYPPNPWHRSRGCHAKTPAVFSGLEGADVKLTLIDKTTKYLKYFALSHCWGDVETLRATKDNLESLKSGIKHDDLPKTFREAVDVTRALGYQYLWIDSLCIAQDDSEDWKYEARRMVLVYGNTVCTLMAMDSLNSNGGLFDISPSEENIEAWMPDLRRNSIPMSAHRTRGWRRTRRICSSRRTSDV